MDANRHKIRLDRRIHRHTPSKPFPAQARKDATTTLTSRAIPGLLFLTLCLPHVAHARTAAGDVPAVADDGTAVQPDEEPPPSFIQPAPETDEGKAMSAKLKGIEERIIAVKEKIFNTKAKLIWLNPGADGVRGDARLVLEPRNELGAMFQVESLVVKLDGRQINGTFSVAVKPTHRLFSPVQGPAAPCSGCRTCRR